MNSAPEGIKREGVSYLRADVFGAREISRNELRNIDRLKAGNWWYYRETPPPVDHAPSRCPVCGRADCPEDPPGRFRADWLLLIVAIGILPVMLGALVWWIGPEAIDVIERGLGSLSR